ncbi:hypothetical protein IAQ61_006838 [Plenodomus lingam]|uniref:uncharacterized protein n=1 Tax=Leptosphaeria maculans TaxID=5022 RepID=UPI00332E160D|nr:hypothetical protein IAQ61_006838 [Plenodomus lingam]
MPWTLKYSLLIYDSFASYANSSSIQTATNDVFPTSNIVQIPSALSTASELLVDAETALIVQPIQQSVFTSIAPAITFQNTAGEDIATEEPQTILSTLFITPTPTPAPQQSSSAIPSPTPTSSPEAKPAESSTLIASSRGFSAVLSSSVAAVENTTASETSLQIPQFTYSPEEDSSTLPASPTANPTSGTLNPSSGGLPGFSHPGSAPLNPTAGNGNSSVLPTGNSTLIQSTAQTPVPTVDSSSIVAPSSTINSSTSISLNPNAPSPSEPVVEDTTSMVYVTETQYTTVFPSPSPTERLSSSQSPLAPVVPTDAQNTLPAEQSSTVVSSSCSSVSTLSAALPPHPPPVVIITQYTTVTQPKPTDAPEAPSAPPAPAPVPGPTLAPIPSVAPEPSSTSSAPAPVLSSSSSPVVPEPQPTPPLQSPEDSPVPSASEPTVAPPAVTESSAPPPEASASTTQDVPAPTEAPPEPSSEPIPTSTTEGPLIITPIAPSQIFTVTVTATDTIRETTTVTVTA